MKVLAKKGSSASPHTEVCLWTHTHDVWEASRGLFGTTQPTRLARQWFRFFKVPLENWQRFRTRLDLAVLWHDTGKATCSFQLMLSGEVQSQVVRHEYLSFALFLSVAKRLKLRKEEEMAVRFAILDHHLKAGSNYLTGNGKKGGIEAWDAAVQVYGQDAGIQRILRETEALLGLKQPLTLPSSFPGAQVTDVVKWETKFRDARSHYYDQAEIQGEFRALALALIASDAAGSGLRRTGYSVAEWIANILPKDGLTPEQLEETIIKGRTAQIVRATGKPFAPKPFQCQVQKMGRRAVIVSPCGSGKTLAAWLWAQAQLQNEHASRVLFLYPTRNTATEGFRDYVSWGKEQASLLHGTADYELEGITFQPGDHPNPEDGSCADSRHATDYRPQAALYAMGYWDKQFVSATVDSFLSFSANNYGANCLLPLLCDSLVVVDEVHSFDPQMFNHLRSFLEHCDTPALLMTATLPKRMREEFARLEIPVVEADDPEGLASRPRYHVSFASEDEQMTDAVRAWIESGNEKRLLAVCNTVTRCQNLGEELLEFVARRDDVEMIVYHSRFRLRDRQRIHEEVIRKFRDPPKRLILLSTQVCQMSLDLDADSLYSEIAPLADDIQRMGRANRKGEREVGYVRFFQSDEKPYVRNELEEARERLGQLTDLSRVSQADLAELMSTLLGQAMLDRELVPLFSDRVPTLESSGYRQSDDYTVDAVLQQDLEEYVQMKLERDPKAPGLVVPVPFYRTKKPDHSKAPRFLRVADSDTYTPFLGFQEKKNE